MDFFFCHISSLCGNAVSSLLCIINISKISLTSRTDLSWKPRYCRSSCPLFSLVCVSVSQKKKKHQNATSHHTRGTLKCQTAWIIVLRSIMEKRYSLIHHCTCCVTVDIFILFIDFSFSFFFKRRYQSPPPVLGESWFVSCLFWQLHQATTSHRKGISTLMSCALLPTSNPDQAEAVKEL